MPLQTDLRIKQVSAKLLKKYTADKQFDKREASRFVIEVLKQSGCPRAQHLLGFDAWFKQLDLKKQGKLEMASMTSLALKVARFDSRKKLQKQVSTEKVNKVKIEMSAKIPYMVMKAVDNNWPDSTLTLEKENSRQLAIKVIKQLQGEDKFDEKLFQ